MYFLKMLGLRRTILLIAASACLATLASCGSATEVTAAAATADTVADGDEEVAEDPEDGAEDHGDEDHDDHDDHETSGGFDAHVHGAAELFVAWSGGDVVVDLISPAINIIGFEYEPETEEDLATAAERTEALAAPDVIVFNSGAACTLDDEVEPDLVVDGTHAEVTTSWLFVCDNPDEITELDVTALFAEFPGLLDIDAQWASESRQSASELSPTSAILRFE